MDKDKQQLQERTYKTKKTTFRRNMQTKLLHDQHKHMNLKFLQKYICTK